MADDKEYTTIALRPADKERLDEIGATYIKEDEDDSFSYREVVNFLVGELERQETEYEAILAKAIAQADEEDVARVITRVNNDKEFVKEVSNDD